MPNDVFIILLHMNFNLTGYIYLDEKIFFFSTVKISHHSPRTSKYTKISIWFLVL